MGGTADGPDDGARAADSSNLLKLRRAEILLARGDLEAAAELVAALAAPTDPAADPGFVAQVQLVERRLSAARLRSLADHGRWAEVVETAGQVIDTTGGEAGDEIYQLQNDALFALGGADLAQRHHRLAQVGGPAPTTDPDRPVAALVVRNGMWRIDTWLDTLRAQGITRFFVIDNDSSDGTTDHLAAQTDVSLWRTDASFSRANSGAAWFDVVFRQYANHTWTLILDLDEEIRFANEEALPEFCSRLHRAGLKAATGHHVDLYNRPGTADLYLDGSAPIVQAELAEFPGQPVLASPFRERVFGHATLINKAPLQLFEPGLRLCLGQHFTWHQPEAIAHRTCAVLHYKFTSGFLDRTREIADDADHHPTWRVRNQRYSSVAQTVGTDLYDPEVSVRFLGGDQLTEIGVVSQR